MFLKRLLMVVLAGLLLISPAGLCSCSQEVSAQEITNNVLLKYSSVDTFKMNMELNMAMDVETGDEQMELDSNMVAVSLFNNADHEMQMGMDMVASVPGQGTQKMFYEYWFVEDQAYMHMKMTTLGIDQWYKMDVSENVWDSQDQLAQQIEFLKDAVEITKLGDEEIDGVATYVLQVKPDIGAIFDWFKSQQQSDSSGLDYSEFDAAKIFKDYSLKMWVAKDSSLPVKADLNITMEILPQDVGADASETGKVTINMSAQCEYYDYGEPVTIEIPQEALDAPSLSALTSY